MVRRGAVKPMVAPTTQHPVRPCVSHTGRTTPPASCSCTWNFSATHSAVGADNVPTDGGAVLIAHVTNTHSSMTEWGVQLYFGARVAYLALYAAGVFLLRSLVWNVATLGIAMVLLSLVLNHASAVEHAARSVLYCRSLACDHSFSLGHCTSVQSAFVRNWHIASFRCDAGNW
jgi:MAPEG family